MEETSEPHMETDVSSTTEDVPETQEVTGSDGNVEMIIVVEKMHEEESSATSQTEDRLLSSPVDDSNTNMEPISGEKSPLIVIEVQKSPTNSPKRVVEVLESPINSPKRDAEVLKTSTNSTKKVVEVSKSTIDSSNQVAVALQPLTNSPNKVAAVLQPQKNSLNKVAAALQPQTNSLNKVAAILQSPTNSPNKVAAVLQTPTNSPNKVVAVLQSPTNSPNKVAAVLQSPTNSPNKVVAVLQSPTNSPNKAAAVLQPLKNSPNKVATVLQPYTNSPNKEAAVLQSPTNSPNKVAAVLKSPINSPNKVSVVLKTPTNSPKKVGDVQNKLDTDQKTELQLSSKAQPSTVVQQVETADSSVEETLTNNTSIPCPIKDVQKPAQKTPIKEKQSQDSTRPTSTKEHLPTEKVSVNGKVQCNDAELNESNGKKVTTIIPIDITIERETSNDSQTEISSDTSEKELNKSISRELKSLINSAKESKIISECTQLTSKTRKSRALDTSSSSLNSSLAEPSKIQDIRRNSNNSQKSNCSEKSDKITLKRSMRSQNPEFVSKVKQFLNSVTGKGHKDSEEEDELDEKKDKEKVDLNETLSRATPPKVKKTEPVIVIEKSNKLRLDPYCWRCHWVVEQAANDKVHPPMQCTVCPRSFHYKCLSGTEKSKINLEKNWVCPECMIVLQAESSETRSQAMKKITLGMLCELLKHALDRMMDLNGVEPFMQPVDRTAFPDYDKYVVHPMDLSLMKTNIAEGLYGSTEAFLADAQWILHNSIIFNTLQSKLTSAARALVRSCRAEMGEVEACPECYAAAHARRPTWFTDVCSTPHILLWAKLKGFPYWPAKAMTTNGSLVDVRFFGAHDRAWVPSKDCFLYSEKDPNNFRTKRQDILDSMQEAEQHIRNISRKYGKFVYPPFKTQFDPTKLNEQLKMMIPSFEGEVRSVVKEKVSTPSAKEKSRSNSKSSKCSLNDGDISETEDPLAVRSRKMASGAEIAKMDEDDSIILDKDVSMDVDAPFTKSKEETVPSSSDSRKRRRSDMEEAVITIIETSGCDGRSSEKRKRISEDKTESKQSENQEPSSSKTDDKSPPTDKSKEESTDNTKVDSETPTKLKDNEPSSSTDKENNQRVTPIRIALVTKDRRKTRNSSSKEATAKIISPSKDTEKTTPLRPKSTRLDKTDKTPSSKTEKAEKPTPSHTEKGDKTLSKSEKMDKTQSSKPDKPQTPKTDKVEKPQTPKMDKNEKPQTPKMDKVEKAQSSKNDKVEKNVDSKKETPREDRSRSEKRRNSRNNRNSLNSSSATRSDKNAEKKIEKTAEPQLYKDKSKERSVLKEKEKEVDGEKSRMEKQMSPKISSESASPKTVKDRLQFDDDTSLAVIARESKSVIITNNTAGLPTISCVRSLSTTAQGTATIQTKTTTNAKTVEVTIEANSNSSIFTPTSTDNVKNMKEAVTKLQKLRTDAEPVVGRVGVRAFARMTSPDQPRKDDVQVEIKAEPIEIDDADRHMEKMDLMNAFRLRPVNPNPPSNLRDVRINKVVVTPMNARKTVGVKPPEIRPRAKKTFPQPRKADEGRSELISKNSMVYIPIQPPASAAPARPPRPAAAQPAVTSAPRPTAPLTTVSVNSLVNTVTPPLMQASAMPPASTSVTTSVGGVASVPTVHTVPLMTSVNGQWMFSFQPVMSVGAIDNAPSPPILNGIAERGSSAAPLVVTAGAAPPPVVSVAPATPATQSTATNKTSAENTPGEPPRLQQRPSLLNPLDSCTPIGVLPVPSTAGPVTARLNQNAVKLTDFFRTLLEDSLEKLEEPASQLTTLRLQLEQAQWRHSQEIKEVKHNHELTLAEMRASFDKEKLRVVSEARRAAQAELEAAVKLAKSKQWCANCSQEAQFYCCWNTSYCDYPCQRAHWSQHYSVCQQRTSQDSNGEPPKSPENRLQPQPDLPRSSCVPTLTVGGKVASRPFVQDPPSTQQQKASIIVSMVEDTSGNQTMKCVGTYKPATPAQMAPIIINKQLMNSEEANKKVVASSGGYLIVGAANNPVVTPARRSHTIQYYT